MAVSGTEGARQGRLRGPTLAAAGSRRSTGSRQVLPAAAAGTRSRKALQLVQEEQTQNLQVHTVALWVPQAQDTGSRQALTAAAAVSRSRQVAPWRSQLKKSSGAHCGCCRYRRSPPRTSSRSHCGRCRFQQKRRKSSGAHCGCSKYKKS